MGKVKHHYLVLHLCPSSGVLMCAFPDGKGELQKYLEGELDIGIDVAQDWRWIFDIADVIQSCKRVSLKEKDGKKILILEYDVEECGKLGLYYFDARQRLVDKLLSK
jgi:hypothetical protein